MIDSIVVNINEFSKYSIPFLLVGIPFYGLVFKKIKVYESFVEGAKDGFTIAVRIIPYLVAILVAIGMFRASGALDLILNFLSPILTMIGFPPENLPLALMRPLSGSGSLGLLTDLINQHGANSLIAKIGATMFGSTETTFYVLAVYFGSVGIRKTRHALAAGLIADAVGIISAVFICQLLYSQQITSSETIIGDDIVNIQELDPTIFVNLKYSSKDNFLKQDIYGNIDKCYLRREPAEMLSIASKTLKKYHPELRLLVYDGLRTRSVQQKLWDALDTIHETERTQFVADPKKGSIHNYGAAVDLILAYEDGSQLDMGTGYDHFSELAFPINEDSLLAIGRLDKNQVKNRRILRKVMTEAGFHTIMAEWWHFNAFSYHDTKNRYKIVEK